MTGSSLAIILIPLAGTSCLAAWLALVFYAGRDQPLRGPAATRRPATKAPARPRWPAGASQTPGWRTGAGDGDGAVPPGNATGLASPTAPVPAPCRRLGHASTETTQAYALLADKVADTEIRAARRMRDSSRR